MLKHFMKSSVFFSIFSTSHRTGRIIGSGKHNFGHRLSTERYRRTQPKTPSPLLQKRKWKEKEICQYTD